MATRRLTLCLVAWLSSRAIADPGQDHYMRGLALKRQGKIVEATSELEQAAALRPDDPAIQFSLGVADKMQDRLADAAAHLERAVKLAPEGGPAHISLGVTYFRLGRTDEALRELLRGSALEPNDAAAHQALGVIYRQRNDFAVALPHLERSVQLAPEDAGALGSLAIVERKLGKLDAAQRHLAQAIALRPNRADLHFDLAVVYRHAKRTTDAIAEYQNATRLDPRLAPAHNDLAMLYTSQKRIPEAIAEWNRYLDLIAAVDLPEADLIRQIILDLKGVPTVAVSRAAPALGNTPIERARALYLEGREAHARGEYDVAGRAFQAAYAVWPNPVLVFNLAQTHRMARRFAEARTLYRRYLDLAPDSPMQEKVAALLLEMERASAAPGSH